MCRCVASGGVSRALSGLLRANGSRIGEQVTRRMGLQKIENALHLLEEDQESMSTVISSTDGSSK